MIQTNLLLYFEDLGLIIYAILKAFLPLPSLEVILVPLCVSHPEKWFIYSLEGALGTCVGGAIGYGIAYGIGKKSLQHMVSDAEINKGEKLIQKYGIWAVFIGGITPIPDFLLAYLAGFTRMNFLAFMLSDGMARLLRSFIVCYGLARLHQVIAFDTFGTWLTIFLMLLMIFRWIKAKHKQKSHT